MAPDGAQLPLIPASGLALADGDTLTSTRTIVLPLWVPLGTWRVGAVLWQPDAGVVDSALLSFEVR